MSHYGRAGRFAPTWPLRYGKDDSLYPKDPRPVQRLKTFFTSTWEHCTKRFGDYFYPVLFGDAKPDPEKLETFHEALAWLNGFLEGDDFAVGSAITVADFVLIASVSSIIEAGIDFSKYPNVTAWAERCKLQMKGYESENGEGAKAFGGVAKSKLTAA
ncbi:UNVERIFIED_CONTAM: hypothetical protein GTU68_038669 [Idotea baltica]|nr:hypothetical protein [Idotea baltica]